MDNDALKGSGPSFLGDLARMGGDLAGSMTDAQLAGSCPSFPEDLARMEPRLSARSSAAHLS